MSTLTISAPVRAPWSVRRPAAARPAAIAVRAFPERSAASALGVRPAEVPVRGGALRLTGRGRVVILLLLLVVGAAVSLMVTSSGAAIDVVRPTNVQYVTVAPGDTLWSIAGRVDPGVDRRDTVADIIELNALRGSAIEAGQRIAVPQRG